MKEHNEINKSEEAPTGETKLLEIEKRLGCIERQLDKIIKQSRFQWIYSIGFGGMAIGAGLVTAGASLSDISIVLGGAVVFVLGITTMLISTMMPSKSKNKPDEKGIKEQ